MAEGHPKLYFVGHSLDLERVQVQVAIEKNVGEQKLQFVTNDC